MEKEEKIVAVLLIMAISSLGVAYFTFLPNDENVVKSDIMQLTEQSSVGDTVYFEGLILSKEFTFKGDHLLLGVKYNKDIVKVFIPKNNGAEDIDTVINTNDNVRIQGIVDEYQGEFEIVIQSKNGVKIL